MTIHVTPEPEFSYVSFETNVQSASYEDLVRRVVQTFQPGKFVVTLLTNKVQYFVQRHLRCKVFAVDWRALDFCRQHSAASETPKELKNMSRVGEHWRQLSSDLYYVSDYDMTVAFYSKFPSWGSCNGRGFPSTGSRRRRRCSSVRSRRRRRRSSNIDDDIYYSEKNMATVSLLLMLFIQKFALYLRLHYTLLHVATPRYHFAWRWLRISWWTRTWCEKFGFERTLFWFAWRLFYFGKKERRARPPLRLSVFFSPLRFQISRGDCVFWSFLNANRKTDETTLNYRRIENCARKNELDWSYEYV